MVKVDLLEASAIAAELERMHSEIEALMAFGDSKEPISPSDIASYQARLKAIKEEIKLAAKHETLDRRSKQKTDLEQAFFGPAVRAASANFRLPTNANPRGTTWVSGLYDVSLELSYYIHQLRDFVVERS